MKKCYKYILLFLLTAAFMACQEDDLNSESVTAIPEVQRNEFDKWILENYVEPYNIDFKYRMEDIEADFSKNLVPADFDLSVKMAKIVKHAWLEAYDEAGSIDFTRQAAPKIIQVIGSASWNQGSYVLGTADGGVKVTLYLGNWLDPTNVPQLNENYFKVMHHEFAHILHQTKSYPQEYNLLSASNYAPSGWLNRDLTETAPMGFVTPYAGSQPTEDIAEVTCTYLTYSDEQWQKVKDLAGETGWNLIEQKQAIVKQYMKNSWGGDLDKLRDVIRRRCSEISYLDLDHI